MYGLPYDKLRPQQEDALDWLGSQVSRLRLLEAPPGVGKSLVAAIWAYDQGSAVILTETLSLLRQYEAMGIPVVRGRANFICSEGGTCEDGIAARCRAGDCPYREAKQRALKAPVFATTYASYLADGDIQHFSSNIVCDEGHRIDDAVSRWHGVSITVPPNVYPSPPDSNSLAAWQSWASTVPPWGYDDTARRNVERRLLKLSTLQSDYPWVISCSPNSIDVRPLWPTDAWRWVFEDARRIVVQSATLYGGALLATMLGETDYSYLSIDSPFDAGRRPVYIYPVASLSRSSSDADWWQIGEACAGIMKLNDSVKGLIHVSSRKQVGTLRNLLPKSPPILYHETEIRRQRQELFDSFRQSPPPLWMVSPSAFEGEDFPDAQLRAQIIAKVRYPDMSDPLVAARRDWGPRGRTWYAAVTVANVCQAVGRAMRSENDWGVTYIIDGSVINLLRYHRPLWPNYVLSAIVR